MPAEGNWMPAFVVVEARKAVHAAHPDHKGDEWLNAVAFRILDVRTETRNHTTLEGRFVE